MTEQTHPETGVSQEQDPYARMSNLLASQPTGPAETEDAPEPESSAEVEQPESPASDEPTPDDLEVEQEPVEQLEVGAFEIVHEGQQHKLTREEAIKYARQGFDYTQKTQVLAEQKRQVDAQLRVLSEVQQAQPYLMQERAQVAAIEQQLGKFQNFNWVELATNDPMGYPAQRAQYDVLVQAWQQAKGQYDHKEQAVKQHLSQALQQRHVAENARVSELIPEWKDPQKRSAGEQAMAKHFEAQYGVPFEELNSHLQGAVSVAVAYKAMKYDQLVKSKSEKVKQLRTAPPVTKPGSSSTGSAKADRAAEAMQRLRKTGSANDAMAAILNRLK